MMRGSWRRILRMSDKADAILPTSCTLTPAGSLSEDSIAMCSAERCSGQSSWMFLLSGQSCLLVSTVVDAHNAVSMPDLDVYTVHFLFCSLSTSCSAATAWKQYDI